MRSWLFVSRASALSVPASVERLGPWMMLVRQHVVVTCVRPYNLLSHFQLMVHRVILKQSIEELSVCFGGHSWVHYVISPDFCAEYQNYTFLETLLNKESEICHLPVSKKFSICSDSYMAAILDFTKWLPLKRFFVNISASKYRRNLVLTAKPPFSGTRYPVVSK